MRGESRDGDVILGEEPPIFGDRPPILGDRLPISWVNAARRDDLLGEMGERAFKGDLVTIEDPLLCLVLRGDDPIGD